MNRKLFGKSIAAALAALLLLAAAGCTPNSDEPPAQTEVTLSKTSVSLAVSESVTLTAEVSDGSPVIWNSLSEAVATVSEGVVTGVSAGHTEIYAVAGNGYASCKVTVVGETSETELFLPLTSARLKIGESLTLDAIFAEGSAISWATSSSAIASVKDGVVSGISAGVARITAVVGTTVQECVVTVSEEETVTLRLSKKRASVKEGEQLALTADASDGGAVTWYSAMPAIVVIDQGVITGVTVGTAVVQAWTANASAACLVTVRDIADTYKDDYTLVWNDEFFGDTLDLTKWDYMLGVQDIYGSDRGPMFWGNNELQYYTKDAATMSEGNLVITAKRESMPEGRTFSSARIHTRDITSWTYGYFEARMQTPARTGMWPAFWMLPQPTSHDNTNNEYGYWAANGEIDIMEAKGSVRRWVDSTLHFGNQGHSTTKGTSTRLDGSTEDWHIYALEWCVDHISWLIDGLEVFRVESTEWWSGGAPQSETAPFDVNFYILLNLAVGGSYDGGKEPDEDFVSAEMRVDYVRVYQHLT